MNKQRGISMAAFLFIAVGVVVLIILGMKIGPAYVENKTIQTAFEDMLHSPDIQNETDSAILLNYSHRVQAGYIQSVKASDVLIERDGGKLALSASYQVKVPLVGNVSLLLDFNPSAHQ
ncbi:MAG: DUF4845 domain-containing protein [Gallionellaceae bacterium]|nr:DUF4845 domain-containing protein [Gallionellaceae bacterium]